MRLGLPELPLGLLQGCFKRSRINFEKDLVLLDLRTFAIVLADEVSVGLGLNLGVDISIERADPLSCHRYVALLGLYNGNFHLLCRTGMRGGDVLSATGKKLAADGQYGSCYQKHRSAEDDCSCSTFVVCEHFDSPFGLETFLE